MLLFLIAVNIFFTRKITQISKVLLFLILWWDIFLLLNFPSSSFSINKLDAFEKLHFNIFKVFIAHRAEPIHLVPLLLKLLECHDHFFIFLVFSYQFIVEAKIFIYCLIKNRLDVHCLSLSIMKLLLQLKFSLHCLFSLSISPCVNLRGFNRLPF
jgi:hypothetical protein